MELGEDGAITANAGKEDFFTPQVEILTPFDIVGVAQSELQLMEEICGYMAVVNAEVERLRAELEEAQKSKTE